MHRYFWIGVIALVLCAAIAAAEPKGVGLGLIVGDPTGLSGKVWLDQHQAVDFAAAWSFDNEDFFELHADYLLHKTGLITSPPAARNQLLAYYGIGGRLQLRDDDHDRNYHHDHDNTLGVRVPLGATWLFSDRRFDAFIEIAPVMEIIPETELDLDGAIGARFYFR